ncbi:hypothetical protein WN943_008328 [Citrus x changshan-huyou]
MDKITHNGRVLAGGFGRIYGINIVGLFECFKVPDNKCKITSPEATEEFKITDFGVMQAPNCFLFLFVSQPFSFYFSTIGTTNTDNHHAFKPKGEAEDLERSDPPSVPHAKAKYNIVNFFALCSLTSCASVIQCQASDISCKKLLPKRVWGDTV